MPTRNTISELFGEAKPTPRNELLGLLADALNKANAFANKTDSTMPMGLANPPLSMLAQALSLGSIARTADRASYGEALTNYGKANVPLLKTDTANALMAVIPNPRAAMVGALGLLGHAGPSIEANALAGLFKRNDLARPELQNLISSQRYLDRDIVAQKIKAQNFDVRVSPEFMIDGEPVRAITDGHHALEAAIRSGNKPRFIEDSPMTNDRVNLLKAGQVDDYLESSYHDSPWYNFATKRDLF